jgi:hypothetical protein
MSQSLHLTEETASGYVDKNQEVAANAQEKRLAYRERKKKAGIDIVT